MTQQNILQGDFNPTVPTRIVFGNEKIDSLRDEVKKLGGKRVLVLSGRTVAEKTDSVRRINEGLGDLSAGVYSGLIQRAPLSTAIEAANMAVANGVDTLVGVGGSTISDAARMIAVLMAEGITTVDQLRQLGEDQDMVLEPNLDGKSLPLQVSIPTTLSAGEFNMGGGNVLDDQAGHKIRVRHPKSTDRVLDSVIEAPKKSKKTQSETNERNDRPDFNPMSLIGGPVAFEDAYHFPFTITMQIEDFEKRKQKHTIIQSFSKNAMLVKDPTAEQLTVMDFNNKTAVMLNPKKLEGQAVSLGFLNKMMGTSTNQNSNGEDDISIRKTGKSKQILGYLAYEYEMQMEKEKMLVWFSTEVPFNVSDYMRGFQKLFSSKLKTNWGENFWRKYGYTLEMESYDKRGKLKSRMTTTDISEEERIIPITNYKIQKL